MTYLLTITAESHLRDFLMNIHNFELFLLNFSCLCLNFLIGLKFKCDFNQVTPLKKINSKELVLKLFMTANLYFATIHYVYIGKAFWGLLERYFCLFMFIFLSTVPLIASSSISTFLVLSMLPIGLGTRQFTIIGQFANSAILLLES